MSSKRVWLVTPFSPLPGEGFGGVKTHSESLSNLLVSLGADLTVLLPEGVSKPGMTAAGFKVETIASSAAPHTPAWSKAMRFAAERLCAKSSPDVVFSQGYYAAGCEAVLKRAGASLAAFVHNFHLVHFHKTFSEIDGPRALARYLALSVPGLALKSLLTEMPFLRRSDMVISVSGLNADLLRRFYRVPAERLRVLHNWVDPQVFRPDAAARAEGRRKLGLAPDNICFLCVGTLWRPKGFHVAVKSFNAIARQVPQTVLMFAGSGPELTNLKKLAGPGLLASGRVKFLGETPLSELPSIYNSADVFLMPSIHPEGLAYTLIEAMACGLPSIATGLGGNIESLGNAGTLVPHSDTGRMAGAMLEFAMSAEKRAQYGRAATDRALNMFSTDTAAKALKDIMERLTAGVR